MQCVVKVCEFQQTFKKYFWSLLEKLQCECHIFIKCHLSQFWPFKHYNTSAAFHLYWEVGISEFPVIYVNCNTLCHWIFDSESQEVLTNLNKIQYDNTVSKQ